MSYGGDARPAEWSAAEIVVGHGRKEGGVAMSFGVGDAILFDFVGIRSRIRDVVERGDDDDRGRACRGTGGITNDNGGPLPRGKDQRHEIDDGEEASSDEAEIL